MDFVHILPVIRKHGHLAFSNKAGHLVLHILGCLDQDMRRRLGCTVEVLVYSHLTDGPGYVTAGLGFDMLEEVCCFQNCHPSQLPSTGRNEMI